MTNSELAKLILRERPQFRVTSLYGPAAANFRQAVAQAISDSFVAKKVCGAERIRGWLIRRFQISAACVAAENSALETAIQEASKC